MRKLALYAFSFLGTAVLTACMSVPADLDQSLDHMSSQHKYYVAVHPLTQAAPINRMHAWEVQLRAADGQPVTGAHINVDGGMPQHGHGFPTQPKVTRELGDGRYLVEGMKFSMPGWWQIKLKVDGAAGTDDVTFNTVVNLNTRLLAKR